MRYDSRGEESERSVEGYNSTHRALVQIAGQTGAVGKSLQRTDSPEVWDHGGAWGGLEPATVSGVCVGGRAAWGRARDAHGSDPEGHGGVYRA